MTIYTTTSFRGDGHGIVIDLTAKLSESQWSRAPINEGEFRMGERKVVFESVIVILMRWFQSVSQSVFTRGDTVILANSGRQQAMTRRCDAEHRGK